MNPAGSWIESAGRPRAIPCLRGGLLSVTLMKTSSLQLLGASAICPCTHRHSLLFNPPKAIEAFAFYSCAIMSHIRRFLMALFKKKKEGGEEGGGVRLLGYPGQSVCTPFSHLTEGVKPSQAGTLDTAPPLQKSVIYYMCHCTRLGDFQKPPISASRLAWAFPTLTA